MCESTLVLCFWLRVRAFKGMHEGTPLAGLCVLCVSDLNWIKMLTNTRSHLTAVTEYYSESRRIDAEKAALKQQQGGGLAATPMQTPAAAQRSRP